MHTILLCNTLFRGIEACKHRPLPSLAEAPVNALFRGSNKHRRPGGVRHLPSCAASHVCAHCPSLLCESSGSPVNLTWSLLGKDLNHFYECIELSGCHPALKRRSTAKDQGNIDLCWRSFRVKSCDTARK